MPRYFRQKVIATTSDSRKKKLSMIPLRGVVYWAMAKCATRRFWALKIGLALETADDGSAFFLLEG
jgi:hypothetical protein